MATVFRSPDRLRRGLRVSRGARTRLAAALLLATVWIASPASAELVVLTDGDFFKVAAYQLDGERMRLELLTGGRVTLPVSRIERVVDDEIAVVEDLPVEEPGLELSFSEGQPIPDTPFGDLFYEAGREHGVNPWLVAAVVRAESAFNPRAISPKGARGLMQLMPATAQRFGVADRDLFDPARNIEAGVRYLSWLLERFGNDLPSILASYNAGEGAVARYGGVPPYRETRDYIRRIFKTLGLPADELASLF